MIKDLTLPLSLLRPVRIRELQESALCLSYDKRGIHILVERLEGRSTAVFLNGDYAFRSFEIDVTHDWKGLALTDYDIVVDLASAFDSENQFPIPGAIAVGPEGDRLGVSVKDHTGFLDKETLKLNADVPEIATGLRTSFMRWAFRIREADQFQLIWIDAKPDDGVD